MLEFRRVILASLLLVLLSWPAMGQMKTMRTIVNSKPKPAVKVTVKQPDGQGDVVQPQVVTQGDTTISVQSVQDETEVEVTIADPCGGIVKSSLYHDAFPLHGDSKRAACFWQQNGFELLKNVQMVRVDSSVGAGLDMMSDFYRGWRFSFSAAVASKAEEETTDPDPDDDKTTEDLAAEKSALSLFQANGGNAALAASYPLYATLWGDKNFDGDNEDDGEQNGMSGFTAITYFRLAGTFDEFGETAKQLHSDDVNANAEWAITTQSNLITLDDTFNFEVYTNAGVIAGTKAFREGLGVKKGDAGVFGHGEIGVNIRIGKQNAITLGASYNYYTADGIDDGASVTIGFGR